MQKQVTRRGFVAGAALGAAGISAASLVGSDAYQASAAESASAGSDSQGASAQADTDPSTGSELVENGDTTYGTILNPQEPIETETDYSALFQPLTIAGHTMKNRIGKSAAGSESQHYPDWPEDGYMAFYEQFAKGGVAMICFEASNVFEGTLEGGSITGTSDSMPAASEQDSSSDSDSDSGESKSAVNININSDDCIPTWQYIADEMHKYDVVIIGQMMDMQMSRGSSSSKMASDELETCFANGHMQTTEEVQDEIQKFIDGGERYYKAGFDGIELNASCNHYFSTFLSRFNNCERTDQYSGETIENRCRVLTEIISGIRERVSDDFIIQVLYSGIEGSVSELGANENYTTVAEACEMAKLFEAAGASSLHIRSEAYGHHCGGFMPDAFHIDEHGETGYGSVIDYSKHFEGMIDGSHDGYGGLIEVAARIKQAVSIPVGVVGGMDARFAPKLVNDAIADGKIDFILANRSLMADQYLPTKLQEGRRDECAPCTRCMTCLTAPFDLGLPMYCRVNPALCRALTDEMPEGHDPVPADEPKNVMVIGGGPAGMEAAFIAAQRGHNVTLYEKEASLGGRLGLVQTVKGPHEKVNAHEQWLEKELDVNGVNVVLNTEVTAETVASEGPDAVVVAVGGICEAPDIEGIDSVDYVSFDTLQEHAHDEDGLPLGDNVVIIGAQFQACDIALYLLKRGKKATIVTGGSQDEFFLNAPTWPRISGKRWLAYKGMSSYFDVSNMRVSDGTLSFDASYGVTVDLPFDTLVVAEPMEKNRDLYDALVSDGSYSEVYAVGDCYAPSTIANATARGNIAGRWIGREGDNPLLTSTSTEVEGDQTYTATATGIGDVTVTIGVTDGKIVDASVDTSNETEGVGKGLGEQFAEEIVESGSIDAVSGASVTSAAVEEALSDCLSQAGLE